MVKRCAACLLIERYGTGKETKNFRHLVRARGLDKGWWAKYTFQASYVGANL